MDDVNAKASKPPDPPATDPEVLFSEMLVRVKEIAHDIDERVHHALECSADAEA